MIYVFDLDLTLVDSKARQKSAGKMPPRLSGSKFNKWLEKSMPEGKLIEDKAVWDIVYLYMTVTKNIGLVYFVTARSEVHREETHKWLWRTLGCPSTLNRLIMRPIGCKLSDEEYKLAEIRSIHKDWNQKPVIFDDNLKVCKLLTKNGYTTLQVRYK